MIFRADCQHSGFSGEQDLVQLEGIACRSLIVTRRLADEEAEMAEVDKGEESGVPIL